MTSWLRLAVASAWNRRGTLGLTVFTIALSVALLLGVERARVATREAFSTSVSGTDLVVGARTSPVQLMLYAVFRLGEATRDMRWSSAEAIARLPGVAWTVPIALGDSLRGFPVVGTTGAYFEHYHYGDAQPLRLASGRVFGDGLEQIFEAVLGADVSEQLHLVTGDRLTLTHGLGTGPAHADKPFTVVGVLARTGTPVDRSVHVGLRAIEAIHLDWQAGAPVPGFHVPPELVRKFDLQPKSITALLVGLEQRSAVFRLQRQIEQGAAEPLAAVLPGVALDQLWSVVGVAERTLLAISAMVVIVGLTGLVAVVLASLGERRRELAILRSVGARPLHIAALVVGESAWVTLLGLVLGVLLLGTLAAGLGPWMQAHWGLQIPWAPRPDAEWPWLLAVAVAGPVAGLWPAWRAVRLTLADGLTPTL